MIGIGVLTPHAAPGPEAEFTAMAPGRLATYVTRVGAAADPRGIISPADLRALTAEPFPDKAAEQLITDHPVDVIGYASTTSAYAIGFDAENAMISRLSRLTGRAVAATCARPGSAPSSTNSAPPTSPARDSMSSAGLSQDPGAIEPAAVCEWISHHVAAAQAVFIGGNGFRAAAAIEPLEAAIDRPVLTSNQVLLWQLLAHAHHTFEINGYGRLFMHNP